MKKMFLMLSFVIGMTVAANAQFFKKSPEQRANHVTRVLQKKLNLTADQSMKVKSTFLIQAIRLDSLRSHLSADKKTNKLSAKFILLSTQKNVMNVLDNDQQKRFVQWEKIRKERLIQRRTRYMELKG